jgi:hypothetical protein
MASSVRERNVGGTPWLTMVIAEGLAEIVAPPHRARQAEQPGIRPGRLDRCPLAQAVSGPHQRRCNPECDIPRERMARSCEALSPDIPGGLQCFAFTPERC